MTGGKSLEKYLLRTSGTLNTLLKWMWNRLFANSPRVGTRRFSTSRKVRECFGLFAYLFQCHTGSVIHDGEMLLIVIQVIKRKRPKEQNNSSVSKVPNSSRCTLRGEASTCWKSAARTRRSCRAAGAGRSAAAPRSARRTSPAPRPRAQTAPAPRCTCTPPAAQHVD